MPESKYSVQQEHLKNKRKQLRVWVESEKYERFAEKVKRNGTSIYALVNQLIDDYLQETSESLE